MDLNRLKLQIQIEKEKKKKHGTAESSLEPTKVAPTTEVSPITEYSEKSATTTPSLILGSGETTPGEPPSSTAAPGVQTPRLGWSDIGLVTGPEYHQLITDSKIAAISMKEDISTTLESVSRIAALAITPEQALASGLLRALKTEQKGMKRLMTTGEYVPQEQTPLNAFVAGFKAGWGKIDKEAEGRIPKIEREDVWWYEVAHQAFMGENREAIENFMIKNWFLRGVLSAEVALAELGAGVLFEVGYIKAGAKVAKVLPGFKLWKGFKPAPVRHKIYSQWLFDSVKKNTGISVDDVIRSQLKIEDVPVKGIRSSTVPGDVAKLTSEINVHKTGLYNSVKEKPVIEYSIQRIEQKLSGLIDDYTADSARSATAFSTRQHEIDLSRLAKKKRRIDIEGKKLERLYDNLGDIDKSVSTKSKDIANNTAKIKALQEGQPVLDHLEHSRQLKELYIEKRIDDAVVSRKLRGKFGVEDKPPLTDTALRKQLRKRLDNSASAISMGNRNTIGELFDDEFLTLFEDGFIENAFKPASRFLFKKVHKPVIFGKERPRIFGGLLGGVYGARDIPPFYNWITPQAAWYTRKGARQVLRPLEYADVDNVRYLDSVTSKWKIVLDDLKRYVDPFDDEVQQRIFKHANGYGDEATEMAYRARISDGQRELEEQASIFINKEFDNMWDMFEAKGMIPEGLKRERPYITNIVKYIVDDAKTKTGYDLDKIAPIYDLYKKYAKTDIDIHEFINRVIHEEEIIENADIAFRSGMAHQTYKLFMEPAFKESSALAELTGNELIIQRTKDIIKFAIKGQITPMETNVESFFQGAARLIERGTKRIPFVDFVAEQRAAKQLIGMYRKFAYGKFMWGRPRSAIRNSTQTLLDVPITGIKSWIVGGQMMYAPDFQRLMDHCDLLVGRMPMTDMAPTAFGKVEKAGYYGFRAADHLNITHGFAGHLHNIVKRNADDMRILANYGYTGKAKNVNNFVGALADAFDDGLLQHVKLQANDIVHTTQYGYKSYDMPLIQWRGGPVTKGAFQFSSWFANYYYSYLPTLAEYSLTGKAPWGKLGMFERQMFLKHALTMEALAGIGKGMGIDFKQQLPPGFHVVGQPISAGGAVPYGASPMVGIGVGVIKILAGHGADNERQISEGWQIIGNSTLPIPLILKELGQAAEEESIGPLLFKTIKQKKPSGRARKL